MLLKLIKLILIVLVLVLCTTCKKSNDSSATPKCISELIIDNLQGNNCLKNVIQYQYKGITVYLFEFDCPDFSHNLYDKNCQLLCSPSGGFTGNGDGKCPEFYIDATDEVIIWQR